MRASTLFLSGRHDDIFADAAFAISSFSFASAPLSLAISLRFRHYFRRRRDFATLMLRRRRYIIDAIDYARH
jgi:hypothetical protein